MAKTQAKLQTCQRCGREYPPTRTNQLYCSRVCYGLDRRGERHHRFKGGNISPDGYRRISVAGVLMLEHRVVMERHLGRPLLTAEVVHHKDSDRQNNSIDNLELLPCQSEHNRVHYLRFRSDTHKECTICGAIKERSEFYRSSAPGRDSHSPSCKACLKAKYPHSVWIPKKLRA